MTANNQIKFKVQSSRFKVHILSSVLLIICFLLVGCVKQDQCIREEGSKKAIKKDVYKIAVAAPQFGPYAALGHSIVNGARLAVDLKNEKGGINGKEIELLVVDDGGLPGDGTWRARDLVKEMVLGVIGHLNSDISIPASEIYAKAMIPQISPGSTSPLFTEREKVRGYVFRTIGRDDNQGKLSLQVIKEKGFKKVGVLYNDRPYGASLASEFVKQLSESTEDNKNLEVVLYEKYKVGKSNFSGEISLVTEKSPDVVFFVGEYGEAAKFLKQLREAGHKTVFLGSEGVFDQEFIDYNKESAQGAYVISSLPVKDKSFIEKYKKKFGKELGSYSASSFDATNILLSAIEKVKDKNPEKVAKEIQKTKEFNGVIGKLSFNSKGDLEGTGFAIYEVKDGEFVPR